MKPLAPIENFIAKLHNQLPHLPEGGRKLLAENIWWIILVFAILNILGLISSLITLSALSGFVAKYSTPVSTASSFISIAVSVATTVLMAFAVKPLKAFQSKGWNLVFLSILVSLAYSLLVSLINLVNYIVTMQVFNVFGTIVGIIITLVFTAIPLYFLFEVRSKFTYTLLNK